VSGEKAIEALEGSAWDDVAGVAFFAADFFAGVLLWDGVCPGAAGTGE